jgi:putative ABC transport system permease protein
MSFLMLISKNLFRQRVRSLLTILGISIGIMTVVTLGVVVDGMKASMSDIMHIGGSDFMVGQEGSSDLTFSTVTYNEWQAVAETEGVEWAHGVLMHITRMGSNPYFILGGILPEQLAEGPPDLVEGRLLAPGAADEIVVGDAAADDLGVVLGDTLTIDEQPFHVVGIYHTGATIQDRGAFADLNVVSVLARKQGVVTTVYVKVEPGVVIADITAGIEEALPQLATITSIEDYGEVDQGVQIVDAVNLAISALAVGIGAIGVMNTMVMSVFERTREIGILRAIGWSGRRIMRMIITESLLLCLVAAIVGLLFGVLATRAVMLIGTVQAFLEPQYTLDIVLRALFVAIIVALIGAAYPAIRAVRLTPMEALRHE